MMAKRIDVLAISLAIPSECFHQVDNYDAENNYYDR
jgi:hypothetical protein